MAPRLLLSATLLLGAAFCAVLVGRAFAQGERRLAEATFTGGCFWCMEQPFDKLDGVVSTTSGYTGGSSKNPTYEEVSARGTGHAEAVRVVYDPAKVGYEKLLEVFWHNIDPLARDRQFCDVGNQYRSAVFFHDEEQRRLAEASRTALEAAGRLKGPIATQIVPAGEFWPADAKAAVATDVSRNSGGQTPGTSVPSRKSG